ncbi:MAG: glycosyltransferase family 2 protein [Acholeplasmatales bacterium]|nr:glycosyltransferase family 2 protein [Acholeplasmatales bacterium]
MHFLDIIIPEYNCPQEYMIRLLNSINRQKNIDFKEVGIIIVNDCSKIKYKKSWFKQRYPKLNINYLIKDINEGQGLTRQYGCDNSDAEYITYIDQDDELYGDSSLFNVFSLLKERKKVFAITSIYEEVYFENKLYYKEHSCFNFKSLHGLFIKREYLKEINLRFHKDLRQYEDIYYTSCLFYVTSDFDYFNFVSYVWKYNEKSLVT